MSLPQFFDYWNQKSSDVETRIKFLGTIQLTVKILLSYYRSSSSLKATDAACDIATKTFRLFRSINNASKVFQILTTGENDFDQPLVLFFRGLEEALCVVQYYHENKLFLCSLGLLECDPQRDQSRIKLMWFLAELCGLAALVLDYRYHLLTIQSLKWRISRLESAQPANSESKKEDHMAPQPPPSIFSLENLRRQLQEREKYHSYYMAQLLKRTMTVIVSGNSLQLFGEKYRLPDSLMNFFGLVSSITGIVESILDLNPSPSTTHST